MNWKERMTKIWTTQSTWLTFETSLHLIETIWLLCRVNDDRCATIAFPFSIFKIFSLQLRIQNIFLLTPISKIFPFQLLITERFPSHSRFPKYFPSSTELQNISSHPWFQKYFPSSSKSQNIFHNASLPPLMLTVVPLNILHTFKKVLLHNILYLSNYHHNYTEKLRLLIRDQSTCCRIIP